MKHASRLLTALVVLTTYFLSPPGVWAQLEQGDYVAVIGDSITEQRLYSIYIEDYLLMCQPTADLRVTQFGWGGETAPGFARRMDNDMLRFGADVATTCFGMNDGGYSPMDPGKGDRYRNGQTSIVEQLKKAGARVIVVGSPGCVDADTFRRDPTAAEMYNKTLAALRDIARDVAKEQGVLYANVFEPMVDVMTKTKAKYGSQYHLAGGDGVHPDRNGHLVMAYAFLKALGCNGDIGTITVDLNVGKATATSGHKILSSSAGRVEIESTRYPFCFYGEPNQTGATRGVIEFLPFNSELNRYRLVVRGADGKQVKVTWGDTTQEFSGDQLTEGINLAAEFLDNPFSEPFQRVEQKISEQQGMEVALIKTLMHNIPLYKEYAPAESESLDRIATTLIEKDRQSREASAAAVVPVRHTISLEIVN